MELGTAPSRDDRSVDRSPSRERSVPSSAPEAAERALGNLNRFSTIAATMPRMDGNRNLTHARDVLERAGRHMDAIESARGKEPPAKIEAEIDKVAAHTARQMARLRYYGLGPGLEDVRERLLTPECRQRTARQMATALGNPKIDAHDLKAMTLTAVMTGIDLRDVGAHARTDGPNGLPKLAIVAGTMLGKLDDEKLLRMSAETRNAICDFGIRNGVRAPFFQRVLDMDAVSRGDPDYHTKRLARDVARGISEARSGGDVALAREIGRAGNVVAAMTSGDRPAEAASPFVDRVVALANGGPTMASEIHRASAGVGAVVERARQGGANAAALVPGIADEAIAAEVARAAARGLTKNAPDQGEHSLHGVRTAKNLDLYAEALGAADAYERSEEAVERFHETALRARRNLEERKFDLALKFEKAAEKDPGVQRATASLESAQARNQAINNAMDRLTPMLPPGLRNGAQRLGDVVRTLAGADSSKMERAGKAIEAARAALKQKDPEIARLAQSVQLMQTRSDADYFAEAQLITTMKRDQVKADRVDAFGVHVTDFDSRVRKAAISLSGAVENLAPLKPEVDLLATKVAEKAPRPEILEASLRLEERCRQEFGIPASVAVKAMAAADRARSAIESEFQWVPNGALPPGPLLREPPSLAEALAGTPGAPRMEPEPASAPEPEPQVEAPSKPKVRVRGGSRKAEAGETA